MITYAYESPLQPGGKPPVLPEEWEHGFLWEGDGQLELKHVNGAMVWGKILTKWGWWLPQETIAEKGKIYVRPYKLRYVVTKDLGDGPMIYTIRIVRETDKFMWTLNKDGTERKRAKERDSRVVYDTEQEARNEARWAVENKMVSLRRQLECVQSQLEVIDNIKIIDT